MSYEYGFHLEFPGEIVSCCDFDGIVYIKKSEWFGGIISIRDLVGRGGIDERHEE